MMLLIAFVIFSAALFGAGYYVWSVPQQNENEVLVSRLRELRARGGMRTRSAPDLIRTEQRGALAAIGDFIEWVGIIRRLQETIYQADLRYRASEIGSLCLILFLGFYLFFGLFIPVFLIRLALPLLIASTPILWILYKRNKRMSKFEQQLPECIDLFNRSMKAGHNIHAGLETVASETSDPAKQEFRKVVEELGLGMQLDTALHNLGKRVPIKIGRA